MPRALAWPLLLAATAAASVVADVVGIPGGALFGALIAGMCWALFVRRARLSLPEPAFVGAQAVIGVEIGLYLQTDTLRAVSSNWLAVTVVSVATLAATLAAGLLLARATGLDRPTASLGMVAGGATGIVAMARDLGADDRLVAVMQYLRVVVIVMLMPLLASALFGASAGGGADSSNPLLTVDGLALVAGACAAGLLLARVARLPAGALLGPMIVSGVLGLTGAAHGVHVPELLRQLAFAGLGLQVGLRFTPDAVRRARDTLGWVLATIALMIAACAALGWVLSELTGVSMLDGYLATTPGGLYAVLATAVASGANAAFVLAVQSLRLVLMMLAAPALIRRLAVARA
jgi:uncharacterized protein